ncbi:four helix bundle sensory module for signal transduction [Lucifera butyrica]|uniref:Four helix bundle sensory module for signal transduction n=1 Tax=Lucifera butyrica TaxID=1351585 RepID=A0A498R9I4_9FIRM|nr:methyl-accepting chemotaxis protein [Lucifera butyrica]VBB07655.1 four helix bundle sensory module for signal transduction [Lucifera butyrica]
MQLFRNLKMGHKIVGLILIMAIFLGAVGFAGYYYTAKMSLSMDHLYTNNLLAVKWLNETRVYTRTVEALTISVLNPANLDTTRKKSDLADSKDYMSKADAAFNNYKQSRLSLQEQDIIPRFEIELKTYKEERQKALGLAEAGKKEDAYIYFVFDAKPHLDRLNKMLSQLADLNAQQAEAARRQGKTDAANAARFLIVVSLIAILLSLSLGIAFSRFTAKRLSLVANMLTEIARGNINPPELHIRANDEIGQIGRDLNSMTKSLRSLIRQVADSSDQVAASAEELTAGAGQSAKAANQVASSITDVAAGSEKQLRAVDSASHIINQITQSMERIAVNTQQVEGLSNKTASLASNGQSSVDTAVKQMQHIQTVVNDSANVVTQLGDRSKEIGTIVDTIANIAGQTDLLALNAAIEAARAGEQGRGFAVVAEEVRKLAEQSQNAAKQIADLIHEIQTDTEKAVTAMSKGTHEANVGKEVVDQAGISFNEIAALIEEIARQLQEISQEFQQVVAGHQQIAASMQNVETICRETADETQVVSASTQEQSAAMEQIATSSRNLTNLAEHLQSAIRQFHL